MYWIREALKHKSVTPKEKALRDMAEHCSDKELRELAKVWPDTWHQFERIAGLMKAESPELLTISQFAAKLGLRESVVSLRVSKGLINHERVGHIRYIPTTELEFYITHVPLADYANNLGLGRDVVWEYVKSGRLESQRVGKLIYINRNAKISDRQIDLDGHVTPKQYAINSGVSKSTVYDWVRRGKVKSVKVGGFRFIKNEN